MAEGGMGSQTVIAKNVTVGDEWIEITPEKPLPGPSGYRKDIYLVLPEAVTRGALGDDKQTVAYADGTKGKIEIEQFDDKGKKYIARGIGVGGYPGGFLIRSADLDDGRVTVKLRLRSDKKLNCEEIRWIIGAF